MSLRFAQSVLLLGLSLPAAVIAQSQGAAVPAFEVASVRLSPGPGRTFQRMTDSRLDLTFINLRSLLLLAFRAKGYELSGPDWLAETQVSIQATLPAGATRRQVPEMLQRLLSERFHLMVHREPRPMDVYELVAVPGGHKMREVEPADELDKKFPVSKIAEQFGNADRVDTVQDTPEGPVRTVAGDDLGITKVTGRTMYKLTMNMDRLSRRTQTLDATRMTMAELATVLTDVTGQPVLDKTDLRGTYQFGGVELPLNARVLKDAREAFASRGGIEVPYVAESKAIEAIGLRLERRRSPIDVIVVDRMNRVPEAN